ncbi:cytochrome P450 89A2-like [Prosopis cineraria]|uniref:cytochrome P450 89A2-like n=1 Tax=Prosopis cineraria TaxID=364024 RepID=UPI00240F82F5|nr:cytochrome P450 89A2-like [Prosopis cineraria]
MFCLLVSMGFGEGLADKQMKDIEYVRRRTMVNSNRDGYNSYRAAMDFGKQRVVDEIRDVMGEREDKEVKEEDLQRLPYLKAVILEGLRRHPPAHFLLPHAVSEGVFLNNYSVPRSGIINFMLQRWDELSKCVGRYN